MRTSIPRTPPTASDPGLAILVAMTALAMLKLFLTGFAIVGIGYVCVGSGLFDKATENWWGSLPGHKKAIFTGAIAATLLNGFL